MASLAPIIEPIADGLANSLRGAFCEDLNLVQRLAGLFLYPEQITDTSIRPALEFLVPRSCPPRNAGTTPVLGGQCQGVLYRVPFTVVRPDGSLFNSEFRNVLAPITGLAPFWTTTFLGQKVFTARILCPNDQEQNGERRFGPFSYFDPGEQSRMVLGQITREDGLPDNCGNAPLLPPVDPQPWPSIVLPDIVIDVGGVVVNFSPTVTLNNVVNLPDFGGLHIPVNVTFAPNIIIPGGLPTVFFLAIPGMNINLAPSFQWDIVTNVNTPGIQRPCPTSGGGCDCEDIGEVVARELDEKFPPARPFGTITESFNAVNAAQIPLPPFTNRVDLELVDIPQTARVQSGGAAPNIYFAGSYSFGAGGSQGDRSPVSYIRNTYYPPTGARNFTYTLNTGYTGRVTIYYQEES